MTGSPTRPTGPGRSLPSPRPEMRRIVRGDEEWPRLLNEAPQVATNELFLVGRAQDREAAYVAIVGTRFPTAAGVEVARELATSIAQGGYTVLSGLAVGIDSVAHRSALEAGGVTVAVVGAGLDVDYPQRNRALRLAIESAGAVISRHPLGTPPAPFHFPERNHVIAGMSLATVVVEGGLRSGALITARSALEANRAVFAVPGSVRNAMAAGPNELIKRSEAAPITCAQDLFSELAPATAWDSPLDPGRPIPQALDPEELLVAARLDDVGAAPDALADLGLGPGRLGVVLARLEVRGLAARDSGGFRITEPGAQIGRAHV